MSTGPIATQVGAPRFDIGSPTLPRSAFQSRAALAIIALALLAWLPFLNQAFTVDDTNFLALAAHARPHLLGLYDFHINWLGEEQRAFDILANPPLVPWYLALVSTVARGREWVFHLSFWPFMILMLAGAYRLGRRFAPEQSPLWTMVWTVVAPGLMVSAHNVMPDLPLLGCYVLGTALTIDAFDQDKVGLAIGGGFFAGLSALCRYSGMTVIPLLVLYAWLNRVRLHTAALAIAAAAAPITAWSVASYQIYGRVHWIAMAGFEIQKQTHGNQVGKMIYQLTCLGLVIGLAPLLALMFSREPRKSLWVGTVVGVAGAPALGLWPHSHRVLPVQAGPWLALGLAGAGLIGLLVIRGIVPLRKVWDRRYPEADTFFLVCWIVGILLFNHWLRFVSVRYVLLALVPTVLLSQRAFPSHPRPHNGWWFATVISLVIAILLSVSDQQFAGLYRDYAATLPAATQQRWFTGHWGLQYYFEETGA